MYINYTEYTVPTVVPHLILLCCINYTYWYVLFYTYCRPTCTGALYLNPPTFGTFFIQVDAPFETIRCCGFEWWNNCVQCWFPKWFLMVGQLIQNLVWIFPNGSTANTKPCLDTSKWWINGPSKTTWMDLNGSTACYQHCSNGITMCVENQWAFLEVEILNGFKWSISRRVNILHVNVQGQYRQTLLINVLCNHWNCDAC